jgi:CBS domain-containing protein
MKIKEIYRTGLATVQAGESLAEAAAKLAANEVGALAVLTDGRLTGVISERDLIMSIAEAADLEKTQVADYMTPGPLTAEDGEDLYDVINRMLEAGIRHMPVTHDGVPTGMISLRDLIALAEWPGVASS